MKQLVRLTAEALRKAEGKGKAAGWYALCRLGYLPAEIAVHSLPVVYANDVVQSVRMHANRHDLPVPVACAPKRERTISAPPEDWRAAFRATVMRTGLALSLSQPMLEYLCAVADGVTWDRSRMGGSSLAHPANTIATCNSLEKRGLIRRKPPSPRKRGVDYESVYALTEAGEHLIALLKSVGIFIRADAAIERQAAREDA